MEQKTSIPVWLAVACFCMGLLPDLALTAFAAWKPDGSFLWPSLGIQLVLLLVSLACFLRAARLSFGRGPAEAEQKPDWPRALLGCFPCLLVLMLFTDGLDTFTPVIVLLYGVKRGICLGVAAACLLLLLLLLGISFLCWMNGCRNAPVRHPIRRYFRKLYLGLPMSLLLLGAVLAVPGMETLAEKIWNDPADIIRHLALFLGCLLMAALLYISLKTAGKILAEAEVAPQTEGKAFFKKYLLQLAALLLCLLLFLSQNLARLTGDTAALLDQELQTSLVEYSLFLSLADAGGAAGIAVEAVSYMDEALEEAEAALQQAGDDKSASRKAEHALERVQNVCDKFEIFRSDGQAIACLETYYRDGGADRDLVDEAVELAEEYTDNFRVQYTAAMLGSSLTYDGADHYDQTAEAILRCEELYRTQEEPTEEEQLSFTKGMAQMLYQVYHDEDAADLLEGLTDQGYGDDRETNELLARCYDRMEKTEEAYALATAYCETHDDSPYLLYSAALTALKQDERMSCLEYTARLAAYTAACEGDELNNCDAWLFDMMEYLTLFDNRAYTGFQLDIYEDLTEEENALIDEDPFLRNYLDAVYLAYNSDHKDEPEDAFACIDAVLAKNPSLASAWYVRGIIASNSKLEDYQDQSVEYYQKAGELNDQIPAVWYAMAKEYDRMGEYEKGIEACKKALALLPEQDHGYDWYGINYHCSRLLSSLENEVKNKEG